MTPAQFEHRMKELERTEKDPEHRHLLTDRLMVECLKANGFGAGAEAFEKMTKWYA